MLRAAGAQHFSKPEVVTMKDEVAKTNNKNTKHQNKQKTFRTILWKTKDLASKRKDFMKKTIMLAALAVFAISVNAQTTLKDSAVKKQTGKFTPPKIVRDVPPPPPAAPKIIEDAPSPPQSQSKIVRDAPPPPPRPKIVKDVPPPPPPAPPVPAKPAEK